MSHLALPPLVPLAAWDPSLYIPEVASFVLLLPDSCTHTSTQEEDSFTPTSIHPRSGVNLTAFDSRFRNPRLIIFLSAQAVAGKSAFVLIFIFFASACK